MFPKQLHHFTFPAAAHEDSDFSTSLPTLNVCLFYYSHSSGCDVVPRGFDLYLMLSIFSCAYWPFVYLLGGDVFSNPLPIKKIGLFVFLLLNCKLFSMLR